MKTVLEPFIFLDSAFSVSFPYWAKTFFSNLKMIFLQLQVLPHYLLFWGFVVVVFPSFRFSIKF